MGDIVIGGTGMKKDTAIIFLLTILIMLLPACSGTVMLGDNDYTPGEVIQGRVIEVLYPPMGYPIFVLDDGRRLAAPTQGEYTYILGKTVRFIIRTKQGHVSSIRLN